MTKPKTPCYGCNERKVRCHGVCQMYRTYRERLDAYNAENAVVWWGKETLRKPFKKNVKRLT